MDSPAELSTVLSLCTGYGGIERGLELAGFEHRVVAHVEIEAFAIANLAAKMEAGQLDAAPIWSNLKTLPVDCFRDRVYLLTGGYPCQPFSAAGKRKGKDDPRHLWPYIHDIIQAVRPVQCFFENVEGHISLGLREVIEDLEGLGYKTTFGIFSASEVGAPHQRKRVFILANSRSARSRYHVGEVANERRPTSENWREVIRQENREERTVWANPTSSDASTQRTEELANPDSDDRRDRSSTLARDRRTRLEYRSGSERQSIGQPKEELANPDSFSLQGVRSNEHQEGRQRQEEKPTGLCSGTEIWDVEPNVGRVAHGIADRVDRLRLLGNGVVPQTAAKAWIVLNEQIKEDK